MDAQVVKTNAYLIGGGSYDGDSGRMARHHAELITHAKEVFDVDDPCVTIMPAARRNGLKAEISDWSVYARDFKQHGAVVSELLIGRTPEGVEPTPEKERVELITGAHIIWVPGGDTRWMLEDIRREGLEEVFHRARDTGVIISGTSAGALWAFGRGVSDSEYFDSPGNWNYIEVEGLGLISQAALNVHDNQTERPGLPAGVIRANRFDAMLAENNIPRGLALNEHTALQVVNGKAQVRRFETDDKAHLVSLDNGRAVREELDEGAFDLARLSLRP